METPADYRVTPPALLRPERLTEPHGVLARLRTFLLNEIIALTARAERAEAQRDEATRELSYERQMRQQTEQAMITLGRRVLEQQAELAEQEVNKLTLLRELRQGRAALHNATR